MNRKKRDWSRRTRQKIAVEYYKRVFGKKADSFSEIPESDREILKRLPLQQAVLFICADDKASGMSYAQIGNRYELSEKQVSNYVGTYRNALFVED